MKIGELSRITGVSIRSLRYYEEQGLLNPSDWPTAIENLMKPQWNKSSPLNFI